MKKTIILLGFIAILASCHSDRIAELEAENMELKATIESLTEEIKVAQVVAEHAMATAMEAQRNAEEQSMKAQEALEKAKK